MSKKLIDVGRISAIYPDRCTARVYFNDRDTVSRELPIGVKGSQSTKDYWMPAVGETVLCLFLPNSSEGFIICSFYGNKDEKPVSDNNKRHLQFDDGTYLEYDSKTHTLSVNTQGDIRIVTTSNVYVTGDVIADSISLKNHTHNTSNGPTSGPIGG